MGRYARLLADFGYSFRGGVLIGKGIRGHTSDRVFPGKFRDAMDAAEHLCPIIKDDEFTRRLTAAE
jgi:hypothetical protein